MGQRISHAVACKQLEFDLGFEEPFVVSSDIDSDSSVQRVVCLVSEHKILIIICPFSNHEDMVVFMFSYQALLEMLCYPIVISFKFIYCTILS